jgi:hypothetical protein
VPTNALLVRWHFGWAERVDATSVSAHTRTEMTLGIGAARSLVEVYRIADGQLNVYRNPREQIDAGIQPVDDTDTPYLAYRVGDTVTVPDSTGASAAERVLSITVSEDDETGRATFNPTFKDVILGQQERFGQAIKKMVNGTVRGDSKVAQPVSAVHLTPPDCCPPVPPSSS